MFYQDAMRKLKAVPVGLSQRTVFITIFIGVVVGPLVMFAISGRGPNVTGQPGLVWSFLMIALLLSFGVGVGLSIFGRKANSLSIIRSSADPRKD